MNTGWEILGLTIKCPSQIHVLNARSSAGNTILRIHGTIRKWGLAAGSCWLGEGPWLYVILAHFLSLSLSASWSTVLWRASATYPAPWAELFCHAFPTMMGWNQKAKVSLFSFRLLLTAVVPAMIKSRVQRKTCNLPPSRSRKTQKGWGTQETWGLCTVYDAQFNPCQKEKWCW